MADIRRGPGTSSPGAPYGESTTGSGDDGGSDLIALRMEIVQIKTRIERMATQEDILRLKLWVLGGVLSAAGVGALIAFAVLRVMSQQPPPPPG